MPARNIVASTTWVSITSHLHGASGVDRLLAVAECAAYLEGHYFAYAFEIAAEAEHVALDVDIAQLHHVLADYRGVFGEVYYFHLL